MFWSIFGRMLWARRAIILTTTACALIGGTIVLFTAPPRYDATARVQLNITRPSISGMRISRRGVDAYVGSQIGLIRDVQVVGRAIEAIGWADNPDVIAEYNARTSGDPVDITTWLAARIAPAVQAYPVEDSDLLEIRFGASTPQMAKTIVGALRDAYISASVSGRRQQAIETAEIQAKRGEAMAKELADLQAKQVEFERKTGIILGSDPVDMDSRRLSGLVTGQRTSNNDIIQPRGDSRRALIELDAQIAQATTALGPNHPQLLELKRRRAVLAQTAEQESAVGQAVQSAIASAARNQSTAIAQQTELVLSQRTLVAQAQLLRAEINAKQNAYGNVMKTVVDLRQQANTIESGLTPVGDVEAPATPSFPDKGLILGGTGGLGLLGGILIALLTEMFNLRIRTAWGVQAATQLPVIGRVPRLVAEAPRRGLFRRRRPAQA